MQIFGRILFVKGVRESRIELVRRLPARRKRSHAEAVIAHPSGVELEAVGRKTPFKHVYTHSHTHTLSHTHTRTHTHTHMYTHFEMNM